MPGLCWKCHQILFTIFLLRIPSQSQLTLFASTEIVELKRRSDSCKPSILLWPELLRFLHWSYVCGESLRVLQSLELPRGSLQGQVLRGRYRHAAPKTSLDLRAPIQV
jgi:hypothetical protein